MSLVVVKRVPKISALEREASKKRASSKGGSCFRKMTGKRLMTILSVSRGFQDEHKLDGCDHVTIKFNPKTKVVHLVFQKKEIPGETRKVSRSCGTAYIQMESTFNGFDLELTANLYRDEFVFKNGEVIVDLSDNLTAKKAPVVARRHAPHGPLLPFNKKELRIAEKAKEEIVQKATEKGMKLKEA